MNKTNKGKSLFETYEILMKELGKFSFSLQHNNHVTDDELEETWESVKSSWEKLKDIAGKYIQDGER